MHIGAHTNVAFSPSPIHLLTAFNIVAYSWKHILIQIIQSMVWQVHQYLCARFKKAMCARIEQTEIAGCAHKFINQGTCRKVRLENSPGIPTIHTKVAKTDHQYLKSLAVGHISRRSSVRNDWVPIDRQLKVCSYHIAWDIEFFRFVIEVSQRETVYLYMHENNMHTRMFNKKFSGRDFCVPMQLHNFLVKATPIRKRAQFLSCCICKYLLVVWYAFSCLMTHKQLLLNSIHAPHQSLITSDEIVRYGTRHNCNDAKDAGGNATKSHVKVLLLQFANKRW